MSVRELVERFATTEVSSRPLAIPRVFVALTIQFQFASPWVTHRMDDVTGAMLLSWAMFASAWAVMFGYKTRWSTAILALSFAGLHYHYGFVLGDERFTDPVLMFQALVLLAVVPCGRSLSVDRVLEVRRARAEGRPPPPERAHRWQLELFVLQLAVIHLWAAIDMSDAGWLRGDGLLRNYLDLYGVSDSLGHAPWLEPVARGLAWASLLATWAIALGLLVRPVRIYLFGLALALEVCVLMLWSPTYYDSNFPLLMMALLPVCLPPARVHAFFNAVLRESTPTTATATATVTAQPEPDAPRPKIHLWKPAVAVALLLMWANIPPYRTHVMDAELGLFAWHWKLYEHGAVGICDLRYFDKHNGGAPIERWKLLGYERPGLMPDAIARVHIKELRADYDRVCHAMREAGDPAPYVEVEARCAKRRGWKRVVERKNNACARTNPKSKSKSKPERSSG